MRRAADSIGASNLGLQRLLIDKRAVYLSLLIQNWEKDEKNILLKNELNSDLYFYCSYKYKKQIGYNV